MDHLKVSTLQEVAERTGCVLCGISLCQTKAQVGLLPRQIRLQVSLADLSLVALLLSGFQPSDAGTPFASASSGERSGHAF